MGGTYGAAHADLLVKYMPLISSLEVGATGVNGSSVLPAWELFV